MRRALIIHIFIFSIIVYMIIPNIGIAESNVITTFDSPETFPMGVEYYENNLLVTSITTDSIYKVNPSNGEVISSFDSPGDGPMDLAWDGTNLWNTDYGYWAFIVEKEISPFKEEVNLMQLFFDNLDIIALLIVGVISERHFISRLTAFSNSVALVLFFIRRNFTPWYIMVYLVVGAFLGLIGLLAYAANESLSEDYYGITFLLYSSLTAGLVMLAGIFLL